MKFLYSLQIPVIATLRDSQAYVRAFDNGIGLFEMKPYMVREDLEQWQPLLGWLFNRNSLTEQADFGFAVPDAVNEYQAKPLSIAALKTKKAASHSEPPLPPSIARLVD